VRPLAPAHRHELRSTELVAAGIFYWLHPASRCLRAAAAAGATAWALPIHGADPSRWASAQTPTRSTRSIDCPTARVCSGVGAVLRSHAPGALLAAPIG